MNYFEHEQRVKYAEGLLSKSCDWDWLVEYIENNFSLDFSISSIDEFWNVYHSVRDIFGFFNSINEYVDRELSIHQEWIKGIYNLSLYCIGKKRAEDLTLSSDFEKVFELFIFLAKLYNETIGEKYVLYSDIIKYNNIFKLIDISAFDREESEIVDRLTSISFDTTKELSILDKNLNRQFKNCNAILKKNHDVFVSANCFSFQNYQKTNCDTWEESFLIEMAGISYENGKLIPRLSFIDGRTVPDFGQWTEDVLDTMKNDFNNEDADYIIESIRYILYDTIPSERIIFKHIELLNEYYDKVNNDESAVYDCSSLYLLLSILRKSTSLQTKLLPGFNKAIAKIHDLKKLSEIDSKYPIKEKKLKKKITEYIEDKLSTVESINDYSSFESFISDNDIVYHSNNDTFEKISDAFEKVISSCEGVFVAHLFSDYLRYLLRIKNNRNTIASEISKEIIFIRHLWKDEYYEIVLSSMHSFENSISLEKSSIMEHNEEVLDHPYRIAHGCMILSENAIIKSIERITSNPLTVLSSRIIINEDFPISPQLIIDNKHEIDLYYKKRVDRIKKEKAYRFINSLGIDEILPRIYEEIKRNISFYFGLFNKQEVLYTEVQQTNTGYNFLEYSEEPTLAHLTQLFPALECKIREFGELFGVSPIREDFNQYNKLKEPSTVLKRIVKTIYDETQELEQVADFIFIFFSMFAENGLGIRNRCIHGVAYNKTKQEIEFAFKVTLFCLYLIENRYKTIQENLAIKPA